MRYPAAGRPARTMGISSASPRAGACLLASSARSSAERVRRRPCTICHTPTLANTAPKSSGKTPGPVAVTHIRIPAPAVTTPTVTKINANKTLKIVDSGPLRPAMTRESTLVTPGSARRWPRPAKARPPNQRKHARRTSESTPAAPAKARRPRRQEHARGTSLAAPKRRFIGPARRFCGDSPDDRALETRRQHPAGHSGPRGAALERRLQRAVRRAGAVCGHGARASTQGQHEKQTPPGGEPGSARAASAVARPRTTRPLAA